MVQNLFQPHLWPSLSLSLSLQFPFPIIITTKSLLLYCPHSHYFWPLSFIPIRHTPFLPIATPPDSPSPPSLCVFAHQSSIPFRQIRNTHFAKNPLSAIHDAWLSRIQCRGWENLYTPSPQRCRFVSVSFFLSQLLFLFFSFLENSFLGLCRFCSCLCAVDLEHSMCYFF